MLKQANSGLYKRRAKSIATQLPKLIVVTDRRNLIFSADLTPIPCVFFHPYTGEGYHYFDSSSLMRECDVLNHYRLVTKTITFYTTKREVAYPKGVKVPWLKSSKKKMA